MNIKYLIVLSIGTLFMHFLHPNTVLSDDTKPYLELEKLLFNVKMINEYEISSPDVYVQKVNGWDQGKAIRRYKQGELVFKDEVQGISARFPADGKRMDSVVAVFAPDNFAFDDQLDRGGKLEFWLKFNEDPHQYKGNKMFLRTEPYPPVLTIEIYGSKPFLALEFQGNGKNPKTNHRFITYTEGWDKWYDWKQGEWHKITLTWKRNKGSSNSEMHLYIDDSQEGCPPSKCNDYNGILPKPRSWGEVLIGNFGRGFGIDYSIRDIKSFGHLKQGGT